MKIRPDVIISDLSQSVILEVKAAELLLGEEYPTNCTLRFPRVVRIRYEDSKPWNEAMTREDLEKMKTDFMESRRMPGKRKLNEMQESGSEKSEEEMKTEKKHKRLRVSDQEMIDILKPQKPKLKLELKSKVVEYFQEVQVADA
jgi:hypothetical protein